MDPSAPVIANLRAAFGARCTLPGGVAGTVETLTVDFADAEGNVKGGTLENTTSAPVGPSITFSAPIPSPGVAISGTTSGTISITGCLRFGDNALVTELVAVTDASGKVSNALSLEVARPAGAPLLPRDVGPGLRKAL